jgi:hypothetical protein
MCIVAGVAAFAATSFAAYPHRAGRPTTRSPLIGLVVLAANGAEIGRVAGISTTPAGRIERIRVLGTSAPGLAKRTFIVARPVFMLRGGAVVLDLSAEDLQRLPTAMTEE